MSARSGSLLGVLAVAMLAGLSACSHGNSGAAPASATTSAALSGAAVTSIPLRIIGWGPNHTQPGVAFNAQPDGSAAVWFRANHSLEGYEAAVDFNGTLLTGNISGDLVTAAVPASLYATRGTYDVHVIARNGTVSVRSGVVKFTVE